jgi:hypothetical protein
MVVDTCCQEFRERESCRSGLIVPVTGGNSDHHRQIDLEERCLLALINHHFRKIIAVFSSSLPPFFLFFYSKILNCNSTQNIYNCRLSFHAISNLSMPSARKFSGLRFSFKLHLKMEPIYESYERDQTCTHTKQAPLFCPRKTRLRRLEPLEFSITVKRGFQWVEERTWEVHRFFSLSYSFTHS